MTIVLEITLNRQAVPNIPLNMNQRQHFTFAVLGTCLKVNLSGFKSLLLIQKSDLILWHYIRELPNHVQVLLKPELHRSA